MYMGLFVISIGFSSLLSLYMVLCIVEYREAIKRLQRDLEHTKCANANLTKIIQEDLDKKAAFEAGCG